jgi:glutamyl-tRNA(Gln) amidotransferase subunit D
MLPETALVKLMWALGRSEDLEEVKLLMRRNITGEYSDRSLYTGESS